MSKSPRVIEGRDQIAELSVTSTQASDPVSVISRSLVIVWIRALVVASGLLVLPGLYPRLIRRLDPRQERLEIAHAVERQQRVAGERVVLPSGEVRRAVVVTPAYPSEATEAREQRAFLWWGASLAVLVIVGAMRDTYLLLRPGVERE